MHDNSVDNENAAVALSDPGERLRDSYYFIDRLVIAIGNAVAWIFPILMIAIVAQVVMRKMGHNQAWLDDGQWWLYGFAMITGFAYAITTDSHVRVDIFHHHFKETRKAKLEIFAIGWLLLPFVAMMIDIMGQYAWASWIAKEGSDSPNGLHRLYILKISLPILLTLACFAGCSVVRRNLKKLSNPTALQFVVGTLPLCWFVLDRICHYLFYSFLSITNPDMKSRKVLKEPLMNYTTITAFTLLMLLIVGLWFFNRSGKRL